MAFGVNYSAPVPYGTIVIWSGEVTAVPSGWHLCDGTGGTPDLRDRFIVGAGLNYAKGATGGEATHKLTEAEIPSHTHGSVGAHTHGSAGAHTHDIYGSNGGTGDEPWDGAHLFQVNASAQWLSGISSNNGAHQHPAAGAHEHASVGGDAAHENRPPYYALAYIMKV